MSSIKAYGDKRVEAERKMIAGYLKSAAQKVEGMADRSSYWDGKYNGYLDAIGVIERGEYRKGAGE